ncbi:hypothetical protein ACA910_018523 [Epithemia clementina (nom. ined.)]
MSGLTPMHYDYERMNSALLCEAIKKEAPIEHLSKCDFCSIDGFALSTKPRNASLLYAIASDTDRSTTYMVVSDQVDNDHWGGSLGIPRAYINSIDYGAVHNKCLSFAELLPLIELQTEHSDAGKRIVLCGHGWGGTIASIATAILLKNSSIWKDRIVCYTFGSPMFASQAFADTMTTRGDALAFEHWIHPEDILPRLLLLKKDNLKQGIKDCRGILNRSPGLTDNVLEAMVESANNGIKYAHVGAVNDILSSKPGNLMSGLNTLMKTSFNFASVCEDEGDQIQNVHRVSMYVHLLKRCVEVMRQYKVVTISDEPFSVQVPYTTQCIKELWKPCYSDLMRAGFEDNKIRFELQIGHRLGSVLPLCHVSGDVIVDSPCFVTGQHLISVSSTSLSYYFSVSEIPKDRNIKLRLTFRSTMSDLVEKKEVEVRSDWFENRESKIEHGSVIDLLAHSRAIKLVSGPSTNRTDDDEKFDQELNQIVQKLDTFLLSSFDAAEHEDGLARIFQVLEIPGVDRSAVLNTLALSMIEAWEKNKKFDFSSVAKRFGLTKTKSNDYRTAFGMPRTSNFLPANISATRATSEMYRFEAAMTFVVLSRFRTVVNETLDNQKKSRKRLAGKIALLGVGSWVVAIGLVAAFGPAGVASAAAVEAFIHSTAGVCAGLAVWAGDTLLMSGAIAYFVVLLSGSKCSVHAASGIVEKFVLSLLCKARPQSQSSLMSHEMYFLESIHSNVSDSEWNQLVGNDALKGVTRDNRTKIVSFVQGYVRPILALRFHLLKKRTFTIAVVGEPGSGKTTFISNAYRQAKYQERTSEQQTHLVQVVSPDGRVTDVIALDFPGMNGNDTFAGADVSNLTAMIPALDCILFFTKLNSRCFLAGKLLDKVRSSCKIRMVLSHVDTCLRNKYYAVEEEELRLGRSEDDLDKQFLVARCVDALIVDKMSFCDQHGIPVEDAVLWTPKRALRDLQPLYQDALSPQLDSTEKIAGWLGELVP